MATICETNLRMLSADDGAPEPSEVELELELIDPRRGHASNVDDWGLQLVKTKDPRDVFACGDCESEACERDLGCR